MLRFTLLGSGSSGNAILIETDAHKILIDNGLSFKQLSQRAERAGSSIHDLNAVFITHEHTDHVAGIGVLTRKMPVPIYITPATMAALPKNIGTVEPIRFFESGETIDLKGLQIQSFAISHDAVDPVGFTVTYQGTKLGFAADMGHCSQLVRNRLQGCHAILLEANYCPDMLRLGDYPPKIQQRIRSRNGHLSNQDMASLLNDIRHDQLQQVVLVHISENNNHPDKVRAMAEQALKTTPANIHLATQEGPTPFFEVAL